MSGDRSSFEGSYVPLESKTRPPDGEEEEPL